MRGSRLRYCSGVSPIAALNTQIMWLWLEKPTSEAMTLAGWSV